MRFVMALLLMMSGVSHARQPRNTQIEHAIRSLVEAEDGESDSEVITRTWPDGYFLTGKPPKEKKAWSEQHHAGLGVNIVTRLSGFLVRKMGSRAIVTVRQIYKTYYVGFESGGPEYTGAYSIATVKYAVERRKGEWRVFSREVLSRRQFGEDAESKWLQRDRAKQRAWERAHPK
jgi:hypothetical protein